jgi:hypothetical protein
MRRENKIKSRNVFINTIKMRKREENEIKIEPKDDLGVLSPR